MQKIKIVLVVSFLAFLASQCKNVEAEVTVFDNVLESAKQQKIDYAGILEKARKGDEKALKEFLDFSRFADGLVGFDHATTCLELLPVVNDLAVAKACGGMKPSMKKLLLERFALAQTRTKKVNLQSPPFAQQFPYTFATLNEAVVNDSIQRSMKPINVDSMVRAKDATKPIEQQGATKQ
jgi:hypothetical protein